MQRVHRIKHTGHGERESKQELSYIGDTRQRTGEANSSKKMRHQNLDPITSEDEENE